MVSAIDRKLLRDLARMRGQVITIALVVACGIASYATTVGCYESLIAARDDYYAKQRFPDVFAQLKRAPIAILPRIAEIKGVSRIQDRLVEPVSIPMEDMLEPAQGQIVSVPTGRQATLSSLALRRGRYVAPYRQDEVMVVESFANAHHLSPGDKIPVVINGVLRQLHIVGIAMSPEVLFAMPPGEFIPDPMRFAVLWMDRQVLANAYAMDSAFNDVVLDLQPKADEQAVIGEINHILRPYGCAGAYGRKQQPSYAMLLGELSQLKNMANVMPFIFLGVAAFLINLVLGRIVQLQRPQIAALKAVGYGNVTIGFHFLKLVLVISAIGTVLGVALGAYLGEVMVALYRKYFHFPSLHYQLDAEILVSAALISFLAGTVGALNAVRSVARLPPAEAMQPEPPAIYRRGISERLRLNALFGQSTRMVLREIERRPIRALLSCVGIASAVALLVIGRFSFDAIDMYMETVFQRAQRQDMTIVFTGPQPRSVLREIAHLPGVTRAEGQQIVRVRVSANHHQRDIMLRGHRPDADLQPFVDAKGRILLPPSRGVVLTDKLAEILEVAPGQSVHVELLEGNRTRADIKVAGVVQELFGLSAHMDQHALDRFTQSPDVISAAYVHVDQRQSRALIKALKDRPAVLGISQHHRIVEQFKVQTADQMNVTTLIMTLFASVIAAGVIYNNARVTLSTRSRDLASLRVLGFRRSEISAILLGELAIQVVISLAPGMILGTYMAQAMLEAADPEQYRFPLVISLRTYTFAALMTLASTAVAALLVRRKLDHLDLIGVLKTRG